MLTGILIAVAVGVAFGIFLGGGLLFIVWPQINRYVMHMCWIRVIISREYGVKKVSHITFDISTSTSRFHFHSHIEIHYKYT